MNAIRTVQLLGEYAECRNCGSDKLGDGEGTLNIDENTFTRTCKCGWEVEIKE